MSKKGYQKRLPSVLPPAPRRPPAEESLTRTGGDAPRPSTTPPPPRSVRAPAPAPTATPTTTPPATPPAIATPIPPPTSAPVAQPVAAPVAAPVTVEPHSTTSPRARVLVSAAVLLGLVGLATAFVAVGRTGDDEPGGAPGAAPIQGGWPEAGASRTTTQVGADGVLDVTHWIHATEPLDELDVALPELPDGVSIDASAVEVVADGRRASGPAMLTFSSASYAFSDATRIRVSYQLSGAVELSSSAPDRGLVTTTTLDVSPVQGTDTRVVRSEAVLSLACAPTAETSLEPCGESDADDQWTVRLTGPDVGARVVAAVTVS